MADNRTMKELLQAPMEGYGEAIVIPKINVDHFEIKTNLLQLVQANPYHGFERENPHTHINNFKRITSTLKFKDVSNDVIKLMMFPYSLEGSARVWYDKEPPNCILTWEDLVNKFVNQFFPLSKTTHLKNEISRFTQRFEETFGEAWERFKKMLRACPHHGFTELSQIDTFYNGLNDNDQDSLNVAAGGNLLSKTTREALNIIENKSKNQASTSGTLPSNTIPNPKGEIKAITTRSGVAYEGPSIPTNHTPKKIVERETEETTDKEQTNFQGSTAHIQPPVTPISKPDVLKTLPKPNIPYPLRLNDQKLREKAMNQMEKFFQIFQDLHFDITMLLKKHPKNLGDPGKFLIPCDFSRMDVCHALADFGARINLMPLSIWKKLSLPELTPTRMTLELANRSITHPKGVAEDFFVKVGKFHFLTDFVVMDFEADPWVPLNLGRSFLRTVRALIDVYGKEITLRANDEAATFNLIQITRYSSTYDDLLVNRIDIIDVAKEEYAQEILGFSKNSSGGNPTSTSEPILSDSSPSLTPFKGSDFILEKIEAYLKDESDIPEIDYADYDPEGDIWLIEKLLNNDPFQLPLMDLKKGEVVKEKSSIEEPPKLELKYLPSHLEYTYLEGVDKLPVIIAKDLKDNEKEALLKIPINPPDQEKTTFTCPYGTFAYREIPFGLCNAPRTFQMCMMAIFHDMIEKTMEVFMDDFSVFEDSFSSCLSHLDTMLHRCEDTNLVLNWEKCHFMVKEEIFLGHKISKNGLEVDRAKLDVIAKPPHPTTMKGVRSFLGHVGFYRRFIQDFSKIARPMTHLLEKETPFVFSKDCIDVFETLKKNLTEAPILVVPDWNLPFELMCDASDFTIGTVLGQQNMKHFQPIHYVSKTMTEAQIHYTTTEKEMLVVVYAFEKFQPYLVLSKSIVYTDHSALKYLLSKQDAKPRLENPHKDVFKNKDINENFPLETLGKISSGSTLWFADFANFHAGEFYRQRDVVPAKEEIL
nr:reverse transcriptase domain-containing protein [Tanacetum cinerariifolium]